MVVWSEWDVTVKEWLIDPGKITAGGFCNTDGRMYAAAAEESKDGWELMWNEDEEKAVPQEDGTDKQEVVNEASTIAKAIDSGRAPPCGLWIGNVKYRCCLYEKDMEVNDQTFDVLTTAKPQGGAILVKTPGGSILIGKYEEKTGQNAAGVKQSLFACAEMMAGMGY